MHHSIARIFFRKWRLLSCLIVVGFIYVVNKRFGGVSSIRLTMETEMQNASSSLLRELTRKKPFVIWNTDLHPAPVSGISQFLEPMGVRVVKFTLSRHVCRYFNTCHERDKLKILRDPLALSSDDAELQKKFYAAHKDDPLMKSADAILCTDFLAICQIYIQFNKPLIIIATTRYFEFRLENVTDLSRWNRWNDDLKALAADPRHFIGANNMYDVKFMRYFIGIEPACIPSYASYVTSSYNSSKTTFLIAKKRISTLSQWLFTKLRESLASMTTVNCSTKIKLATGEHTFSDLASYRGLIHIPYQVSTMSLFEQYRMQIPLFYPSKKLLVKWESQHWLLRERLQPWNLRYIPTPPHDKSQHHIPSPNDNNHSAALDYWLQFADYYTLPHIQYFNSIKELAEMMCRLTQQDLNAISRRMELYNIELKEKLTEQWADILLNAAKYSPNYRNITVNDEQLLQYLRDETRISRP